MTNPRGIQTIRRWTWLRNILISRQTAPQLTDLNLLLGHCILESDEDYDPTKDHHFHWICFFNAIKISWVQSWPTSSASRATINTEERPVASQMRFDSLTTNFDVNFSFRRTEPSVMNMFRACEVNDRVEARRLMHLMIFEWIELNSQLSQGGQVATRLSSLPKLLSNCVIPISE